LAALWDTGGMFKVELYGRVRRAVLVDGVSQRTAAREFGISRKSVRKMVGVFRAVGVSERAAGEAAEA
jgi:transposase